MLGRATKAAISGVPDAPGDLVPQWLSLFPGSYAPTRLRASSGIPLVFLESGLDEAGYLDLIDGKYDDRLRAIRDMLPRNALPRFDHEMDGPRNEWRTWGQMRPTVYVRGYQRVASILGPLVWCPTSNTSRWAPYWPGREHVSMVGWDQYDRGAYKPLPQAWASRIRRLDSLAPGIPKLVCEFGALRLPGRRGRTRWLRSLRDVPSGVGTGKVWGASYFDVNMGAIGPGGPDWTMSRSMRATWAGL